MHVTPRTARTDSCLENNKSCTTDRPKGYTRKCNNSTARPYCLAMVIARCVPRIPREEACGNGIKNSINAGGPSAVETKPLKIDWDFAQKELRDATTKIENDAFNNAGVETTADTTADDGPVEQDSGLDVNERASAKPEAPEQWQQPQLPEAGSNVACEGELKRHEPTSTVSEEPNFPSERSLAAAPETSGSSEILSAGMAPSPETLPGETPSARLTRSEEMPQMAPAPLPGAPVAAPVPAAPTEALNSCNEDLAPQKQDIVSAPSPASDREPRASTSVPLPPPSPECDPPLATVTPAPAEETDSSHGREIVDTPLASDGDASPEMVDAAKTLNAAAQSIMQKTTQSSEKGGGRAAPTEAELPNDVDRDQRGALEQPPSQADPARDDGRHAQAAHVAPPPPPPPSPPPPLPPKVGAQNETELTSSSKAIHVNKATLVELQRAREAWRGAEGELERSQEERDELRATLQAVGTKPSLTRSSS